VRWRRRHFEPDAVAAASRAARGSSTCRRLPALARDPAEIYRNNVEGTRTVVEAAPVPGGARRLHLERGHAWAAREGAPAPRPTPVSLDDMIVPTSARSSWPSRLWPGVRRPRPARRDRHRALPFGHGTSKPTRPARWSSTISSAHVRHARYRAQSAPRGDCRAAGIFWHGSLGRGEKYILGGENTRSPRSSHAPAHHGIRAPRLRAPMPWSISCAGQRGDGARHRPLAARAAHRRPHGAHSTCTSARRRRCESSGCPPPVEQALRDAVDWFVVHGYALRPPPIGRGAAWRVRRCLSSHPAVSAAPRAIARGVTKARARLHAWAFFG